MTNSLRLPVSFLVAALVLLVGPVSGQIRGATTGDKMASALRSRRLMNNNNMGGMDDEGESISLADGGDTLPEVYDGVLLEEEATAGPSAGVAEVDVETETPTMEDTETEPPATDPPVEVIETEPPATDAPVEVDETDPPATDPPETDAPEIETSAPGANVSVSIETPPASVVAKFPENEERGDLSDIIDTALAYNRYKTLLSLLKWTGLTVSLQRADEYTLFAPNDDAFPAQGDDLDFFLEQLGTDQMLTLLSYHVVPGTVTALVDGDTLITLEGTPLQITVDDTGAYVNGIAISPGVFAGNGIIYELEEGFLIP
ncbi:Beta-Ig-H3 fasciclin [Seminavis robusta]|uniref:Beta-Ig-H3 fasciclin n=1 Tax=Seminavis robusta TaxID=568900 RepID=A0A9N8HLI0_9STRA|nr:Beta-Ig-H3 fasciclin [Seminavis robusta]|eukprot:Sro811_g205870.1 Beta-Ig-H3 fasciclin (316) ;mRNA; f:7538-8485